MIYYMVSQVSAFICVIPQPDIRPHCAAETGNRFFFIFI